MSEVWKDIVGYEGRYQISSFGNVRSLDRVIKYRDGRVRKYTSCVLKPILTDRGYKTVALGKGDKHRQLIHRLVAMSFIANERCCPEVNHIDGDPGNNRVENLEWVTPKENMRHALRLLKPSNWPPFNEKPVVGVSENGEVRFTSMMDAERAGFGRRHIRNAIALQKTYRDYTWRFAA